MLQRRFCFFNVATFFEKTAIFTILCMLNSSMVDPVVSVYAAEASSGNKVAVSFEEATGQNPNSSIQIDPDTGLPYGAAGEYTPAEKNSLLGRAVFYSPLECASKYGANFCACDTLSDGTQYCYYNRPTAAYYETLEACEKVWGVGMCYCGSDGTCRFYDSGDVANQIECMGQVYFFSGQSFECRQAGVMSAGTNCCKATGKYDDACSFENVADELGMDDIAMLSLSLGSKLVGMAGYDMQAMVTQAVAEKMVESWVKSGSVDSLTGSLMKLIGDEATDKAIEALGNAMAQEVATEAGTAAASQAATSAVAQSLGTVITVVGWVYFAYQMYNLYKTMSQCTAGELILGCKRAKGECHSVGSRCKIKVAGSCMQRMGVYCCFNSVLARIIHEEGRPQINRGWGSSSNPDCKGFYMDEFAQIDLSSVDFSGYEDDLIRMMAPEVQDKYLKALEKFQESME